MLLVTLIGAGVLGDYLWNMHGLSARLIETVYAAPFIQNAVDFSMWRNVWLPDVGIGVLLYLSYLSVNWWLIPHVWRSGGLPKKLIWTLLLAVVLVAVLGTGFILSTYYGEQYLFNYPGFSFIPKMGDHPQPMIGIYPILFMALTMVVVYLGYAGFREAVIRYIERPDDRRAFRILVANRVTGFLAVYLLLFPVGKFLHLEFGGALFLLYFGLFSSAMLVFLNLYWLFPLKGDDSFWNGNVLLRQVVASFVCTFPVPVFVGFGATFPAVLLSWGFQLLVVTPLSWLLYQQGKDRILQLRGLEKALSRSKADLQFLRSQINPHFLFNTLNTLYGTALLERAADTAGGIQKLGDMMRFLLHENNQELIPLDREIEYLKNYISLQKLRTQSSPDILIEENIGAAGGGKREGRNAAGGRRDMRGGGAGMTGGRGDEAAAEGGRVPGISGERASESERRIAPMLLIPFVENAFKHGISLQERSWIKIDLQWDERTIRLEVRNSIHARGGDGHVRGDAGPEKERSGIGMTNVLERLKLLYPGRFTFSAGAEGNEFVVQLAVRP